MERFLHHCLEDLCSQTDMKNLIDNLSQRTAAHQSRVHQLVFDKPMENTEVLLRVILGVAVDQPVESNFFPGILEGLLGRLSITAHGEKNPPTSAKEGAAQLWASTVANAVQKMKKRQVRLETSGSSGMPSGLHLYYEEDFLNCQSHQVPGVFTDPLFLPNMVNSVYKLVIPPILSRAPPFPQNQGVMGIVLCHPVLHQVLSVYSQKRKARRDYPQPPSKSSVNPMQSRIKPRIWDMR